MTPEPKFVLSQLLVLQAQAGDAAAFRELHELWYHDLRRLARVRVQQCGDADEIANDAWLAIARGLGRLDDAACFPRWAFRIVERRASDWVRRRAAERRRSQIAEQSVALLEPAANPVDGEPREEVLALRTAIVGLPLEHRQLLHLFYELGLSVAEIAAILDVPSGTVKSRLHSVRETLRQKLEPKSP
jgi:RNA polymerase sigma factor (sigma-70 family)